MNRRYLLFLLTVVAFSRHVYSVTVDGEVPSKRPNIILFVTDDQGWGDVSFNGNEVLHTPNIDAIAERGVSLERFYVNPVCSSTRAALLTGRYALRTGVFSVTRGGERMRESEVTLAEMLGAEGYRTGLFGKWHNGATYPHDPNGQGFDYYEGIVEGHQTLYFDPVLSVNGTPVQRHGYIADLTSDAAINFIESESDAPFFAFVPFNTPHGPFEVPDQYFDRFKASGLNDLDAAIYGMMANIDDNVGRILSAVNEQGKSNNTIVLFMSDNGPAFPSNNRRYNGGLKGAKGKVDEGGVRSPLFVHWPNHIEGGRVLTSVSQHIDIVPTLMSLINSEVLFENPIDGEDLSPLLLGVTTDDEWPDRYLFLNHFHNMKRGIDGAIRPYPGAVRSQQWLATFQHDQQWYLYDLENDMQQQNNIAKAHPEVLDVLQSAYFEFFNDITKIPVELLPIQIGHQQASTVTFAAHEALIEGEGIDYAYEWGWAHDWINLNSTMSKATMTWPVKSVVNDCFEVDVLFSNENDKAELNIDFEFLNISKGLVLRLDSFVPEINEGQRRFYTDETPESTWASQTVGRFFVREGQGELAVTINNLKTDGNGIAIKGIVIKRADTQCEG
ncbi:arylsulfatase [Alteromonas sp. KUL49]|uniref:arylsulfatase n=1 Tax=Alteromonas sp. KUL49 TaxID=2480798 RepID=UPI0010FFBF79|nr:arylsulfatase [Alteromonas sp. KUL49]GEA10839.1 hypothetical protein KUL49_12140 [Alteromonas sp. KUL49]